MIILPTADPEYGMTLQEMIDDVADNIRNPDIASRITSWINQEVMSLASQFMFPHLHSTGTITTIIGKRNYSIYQDFMYMLVMVNPLIKEPLEPIGEQKLAYSDPDYKTLTGSVTNYVLNFKSLDLYRIPNAIFTITYSYQRRPKKLSLTSAISDLPPEWHPLIVLGATRRGIRREERGTDEYQSVLQDYEMLRKRLEVGLKRRPDVITIFESPESSSVRRYPRLDPAHYSNRR